MCANVVVFVEKMIKESKRSSVVVFRDECDRGHCIESGSDLLEKRKNVGDRERLRFS